MRILIVLFTLLLFSGCSAHLSKPEVNIVNLEFTETSLLETSLFTQIRIINPNNRTLKISGSKHKISINGSNVGTAVSNESLTIPPLGEATQDLTLRISNLRVLNNWQDILNQNNASYTINSTFYTPGSLGLGGISVKSSGTIY